MLFHALRDGERDCGRQGRTAVLTGVLHIFVEDLLGGPPRGKAVPSSGKQPLSIRLVRVSRNFAHVRIAGASGQLEVARPYISFLRVLEGPTGSFLLLSLFKTNYSFLLCSRWPYGSPHTTELISLLLDL